MTHHFKSLMYNMPIRSLIQKLNCGDARDQLRYVMRKLDYKNFFVFAS